jgi:F-type H+-transporting ATPase subunit b
MLAHAAEGAGAAHAYAHFWEDPTFWVLVASVIFVGLVWNKARAAIGDGLDGRIARIKNEIDEAERLKTEAQEMLADAKRKQGEAEKQIADIRTQAEEEAVLLTERMTRTLDDVLRRREQQAKDRIAQAEEQARQDIQAVATEVAVNAARKVIRDSLDADQASQLVDAAIKELPEKLH